MMQAPTFSMFIDLTDDSAVANLGASTNGAAASATRKKRPRSEIQTKVIDLSAGDDDEERHDVFLLDKDDDNDDDDDGDARFRAKPRRVSRTAERPEVASTTAPSSLDASASGESVFHSANAAAAAAAAAATAAASSSDEQWLDFEDATERASRAAEEERLTLELLASEQAERQRELEMKKYRCEICFSQVTIEEMVTLSCDSHRFCKECIAGYISSKVGDGETEFCCPGVGCKANITVFEIKFIAPECMDKFERFSLRKFGQAESNNCRFCPKCNDWFSEIPQGAGDEPVWKRVECGAPECKHHFCGLCGEKPHKGQKDQDVSCAEFARWREENEKADEEFERYLDTEKNSLQQCPSCLILASLASGCRFVYCKCGARFCFLCGVTLEEANHYSHFQNGKNCTGPFGNGCNGPADAQIKCVRKIGPKARLLVPTGPDPAPPPARPQPAKLPAAVRLAPLAPPLRPALLVPQQQPPREKKKAVRKKR